MVMMMVMYDGADKEEAVEEELEDKKETIGLVYSHVDVLFC